MKKFNFLSLISILFLIVSCGSNADNESGGDRDPSSGGPRRVVINTQEKEVFDLVNQHRTKSGKQALEWHDMATIESQDHSEDIASGKVRFSHDGYDQRIDRIRAYETDNINGHGENIAQNTSASRSRVLDADYAAETTELARTQIIQQAGTAMLSQANQQAQSVLHQAPAERLGGCRRCCGLELRCRACRSEQTTKSPHVWNIWYPT